MESAVQVSIADNLRLVRERISCVTSRPITLIAVTKTFPAAVIVEAARAGQFLFGENYVQEAKKKIEELAVDLSEPIRLSDRPCLVLDGQSLSFHLIGHLQRNKVREAVRLFDFIQSVDSERLLLTVDEEAGRSGKTMDILLQVNISGEETKGGVRPEDLRRLAERARELEYLRLRGLMMIGTYHSPHEPDAVRRGEMRALAAARHRLEQELGVALPELSMGMSHDFELAIGEGATMVRVGSAIFGERE